MLITTWLRFFAILRVFYNLKWVCNFYLFETNANEKLIYPVMDSIIMMISEYYLMININKCLIFGRWKCKSVPCAKLAGMLKINLDWLLHKSSNGQYNCLMKVIRCCKGIASSTIWFEFLGPSWHTRFVSMNVWFVISIKITN